MAKELYGWLTLDDQFQECGRFEHRQAECIQDIWEELGYDEALEAIYDDCQSAGESGEHPEWHCWEMANDDYRTEAREAAYKRGLIRVGTRGTKMHFEYGSGSRNSDNFMQATRDAACRRFAESRGFDPVFESVR